MLMKKIGYVIIDTHCKGSLNYIYSLLMGGWQNLLMQKSDHINTSIVVEVLQLQILPNHSSNTRLSLLLCSSFSLRQTSRQDSILS